MNTIELDKFKQAIELAQSGKSIEAYKLFGELNQQNSKDINVLLWLAYTSPDLVEARTTLDSALLLEPSNPLVTSAQDWLSVQESQRLQKRFRSDLKTAFVPPIPAEVKNSLAHDETRKIAQATPLPKNSNPPQSLTSKTSPAVPPNSVQEELKTTSTPGSKATVKLRKFNLGRTLRNLFLGLLLIGIAIGGLFLIPSVRYFIFDTGPLNAIEQSYLSDVNQINEQSTQRLNQAYTPLLNPVKSGDLEPGFKNVYSSLGEVEAKFSALKSPSNRFEAAHSQLQRAYAQLSSTSKFALDSLNQKKTTANAAELLTRLDENRKLLEQGKAELKRLTQSFAR